MVSTNNGMVIVTVGDVTVEFSAPGAVDRLISDLEINRNKAIQEQISTLMTYIKSHPVSDSEEKIKK